MLVYGVIKKVAVFLRFFKMSDGIALKDVERGGVDVTPQQLLLDL
jgi:hypothetical protein